MEAIAAVDVSQYIQKINQVEAVLEEIKQGLFHFDQDLQESIKRGEKDIAEGKVTVCKIEEDLNNFFATV